MRKGRVFFHPIEGSGTLTISWSSGPKGDAIEAQNGAGVGFFSDKGDLLSVIFDEILAEEDHQTLKFANYSIEVKVKKGKVAYMVHEKTSRKRIQAKKINKTISSRRKRMSCKTK
jgi:hypothetical protein